MLTFPAYLENAAQKMTKKGAKVIIASATPNNVWESGSFRSSTGGFSQSSSSVNQHAPSAGLHTRTDRIASGSLRSGSVAPPRATTSSPTANTPRRP